MIFKTHEANLPQIKAAVNAYDAIYFHGDGNIYPAVKQLNGDYFSKESNDRQTFANPNQEEASYRKLFKKGDTVPTSVEALNKSLMDSKNQDILHQRVIKETASIKTFSVDAEEKVLAPAGIQTATTPGADTNVDEKNGLVDPAPDKDAVIIDETKDFSDVDPKQDTTKVTKAAK